MKLWEENGPILEKVRADALRGLPYNEDDVDTQLSLADDYDGPPRLTSGLVEMQAVFMRAAPACYLEERERRMRQE